MDDSAKILCSHLRAAKKPEDVFGGVTDRGALKHVFNAFVQLIHPDKNPGLVDASKYMTQLLAFRKEAEELLDQGLYGKPRKPKIVATLRSRSGSYEVLDEFRVGEIADLYLGQCDGKKVVLKIVREVSDNDLLDFEARTLGELHRSSDPKREVFAKYLPKLIDSFSLVEDGRHRKVNVLDLAAPEEEYVKQLLAKKGVHADPDYFSLAEIRAAYPDGIDTRDAVWMIRRAFEGLGWVHSVGYVHGAVLPEHVLVHPTEHGARIVGWSYAVRTGQRITAISAAHQDMYPKSVFKREPATPVLDIQLLSETAIFLLNKDAPKEILEFFKACRYGKIKDGWDAYRQYDELLKKVYGARSYRAFVMPPK